MTIFPVAYWGSAEYFARIVEGGAECVVDIHEHYIKRSMRNRAQIMTANGVMSLSVCLQRANRPQTPVCDVRIDYSKRWQHQHWTAICSAYRSSPYFDMIADRIARFYEREWRYLVDYDMEITEEVLALLGVEPQYRISESYIASEAGAVDLRPKNREISLDIPPYFQLFSDRMPFAPNLSILDVLMCEGLGAIDVLRGSCPR